MIKIILVEDEPSALRILKSIIKLKCHGFDIIDTAENGAEGLEKIRLLKPDIVITDIKMGVMDGIEMILKVKEELPSIYSIFVSGYQDFEYAKGAIKGGVSDYILKPINAAQLKNALDKIKEKLKIENIEKGNKLLKKILLGGDFENWQVERYIPFKKYALSILRKNGMLSRFSSKHGSSYDGIVFDGNTVSEINNNKSIWTIYGRDEQEIIFFYSADIINKNYFERYVAGIGVNLNCGYYTTVFSSEFTVIIKASKIISELYKILDNSIVIGISQKIYSFEVMNNVSKSHVSMEYSLENKMKYLLSNSMYDDLKAELIKLFKKLLKERKTELWVESYIRQILQFIEKYSPHISEDYDYNIEFLIDEALYYSMNFDELITNLWDIIERITERNYKKKFKLGSFEFFNSTQKYVEENLTEQISLKSICSCFGISQPYLSRLFRKYENMSFNEYITKKRIDKAKQLMEENPQMPLKDVAQFAGFSDPFYFSRVFKMVTGMPPSEYISIDR